MSLTRYNRFIVALLLVSCQLTAPVFGQLGFTPEVKKPKEFENRVLRSEKSEQKKFKAVNRFIQNTITHYNYYFNATNKLNEVLERAKMSFVDDYSQLISFYNYTLEATAADSIQLDSILYKTQTGIVLHDLRNDWVDNLYLLWGASYYLKQQFDSAYLMFQFINYAFAEKEKDGYYKTIGSAMDGNSAMNISTKEKNSLTKKVFSEPPSRNDAFIWQIRNYLAQDRFSDAASLITALKNDPIFPDRLRNDLEEVQAYSFYKQEMWDSSAAHLEKALSNATGKGEKARWEYLLGQLYEETGKYKLAEDFYSRSISHTLDPIMDIYARLAMVRVNKDGGENYIEQNIASLLKMAKRDKYQNYRDIIYYMAAQMELERKNTDAALELLLKSVKYNFNDPAQKNKAFLQLAELSFEKRKYRQSFNFYDSLQMDDPALKDPEAIIARKGILSKLADNIEIIERQDSLQHIAALPEEERKSLIKKLVRQLRKEQGLKDENTVTTAPNPLKQKPPPQLFAENDKKGDWYFYNKTRRERGLADFQAQWGKRANTDNWRRSAAATTGAFNNKVQTEQSAIQNATQVPGTPETEITFDALNEKLPLSPEKMQLSNDSIQNAQFELGIIYIQQLEDCDAGTDILEKLRTRFPVYPNMEEVLFNLYYCYNKHGENAKATAIKQQMGQKFAGGSLTNIVVTGKKPGTNIQELPVTKTYEKIYDLFIEGNFEEAIRQKKTADSIYGSNHWTPQLLYIEAVYHVRQRDDSTATEVLNNIVTKFAGTPLADKAATMLDVLGRRKEIEDELRNLVINMPPPDTTATQEVIAPVIVKEKPVLQQPGKVAKDSIVSKPFQPGAIKVPPRDTIAKQPVAVVPGLNYSFDAGAPHYVVIVLNKVDPIFVNEAKNAFLRYNRDTYFNKQMQAELIEIDSENRLLLISPFNNAAEAMSYVEETRPKTSNEIVPWLKGGKYSYSIITEKNLEILKNSKDLDKYRQFLDKNIPGKF